MVNVFPECTAQAQFRDTGFHLPDGCAYLPE